MAEHATGFLGRSCAIRSAIEVASRQVSDKSQRGSPAGGQAFAVQARQQLESRLERLDAEIERFGGGARDSLLRRLETLRQHLRSDAP